MSVGPQTGSDSNLPPSQLRFPENVLLISDGAGNVALVKQELARLRPRVRFGNEEVRVGGIVRLEVYVDGESGFSVAGVIDELRPALGAAGPSISPAHVTTSGQPNVVGNPEKALPQKTSERLSPRGSSEGDGVTVAIIDTGIVSHDWLFGGWVAMPKDLEVDFEVTHNGTPAFGPQVHHGLFLAGLVLSQAPGASVRVIRTSDSCGVADVDVVAEAIEQAAYSGADVINLSLGCYTRNDNPPWTLLRAINGLEEKGIAVVASAGNSNATRRFWPGALEHVTAVGALALNGGVGELTEYTNRGSWVDVYVPGNDVLSTFQPYQGPAWYRNDDDKLDVIKVDYREWMTWSGTSMAAATYSGALARALHEWGATDAYKAAQRFRDEAAALGWAQAVPLRSEDQHEDDSNETNGLRLRRALRFEPPVEVMQSAGAA